MSLSLVAGAWSYGKESPCVWLANDLIGMKVTSQQGESLGEIEDVIVQPGDETSYVVLSFGSWLGTDDKLFAMPWKVLHSAEADSAKKNAKRSLVLSVDKERLKAAPGFDKKSWPTIAKDVWSKDVDAFYVNDLSPNRKESVDGASKTSVTPWRVTELKGTNVRTPTGEKLGDLKEVAIDANGRVSYVALSVGGFLGVGDKMVAVPWDSLKFSLSGDKGDKRMITLASTKEQLEQAPQFKEDEENCAEMCDPQWIGSVYDCFSCPPYWDSTTRELDTAQGLKN